MGARGIISGTHVGVMNERKAQEPKTPKQYLPSVESFSQKPKQKHGKNRRRVGKGFNKQKKLGKKLWREWFKETDFIRKF